MTRSRASLCSAMAIAHAGRLLEACRRGFQGWVEADLIFVSPDEAGRVETLSVREGEVVELGAPLFTLDPTCSRPTSIWPRPR